MHPPELNSPTTDQSNIFLGGGEMGALMRAFDWDRHPLGNPATWPESLKINIRLLLHSRFPMFIWWSRDLYIFHNDAYIPALGDKYPRALGASGHEIWAEIWADLGLIVDGILAGGPPFFAEALPLVLERKGFPEETYWTFSYSPAFNDQGQVEGIFCACHEVTATVLNERRLKLLKAVSEETKQINTVNQAGQQTCAILHQNPEDLPFSLIYLWHPGTGQATLIGQAGLLPDKAAKSVIEMGPADPAWHLNRVLDTKQPIVMACSEITGCDGTSPVQQAVVLPIFRPGHNQVIGFFIAGLSPRLEYNDDYRGFHTLLAGQIANAITSVQTREELARQQVYLNGIFQQAPVGIAIVRGPQFIIDLANPGVCEIWGRTEAEVLGKPVVTALPEIADQGIMELLDNVVSTGVPFIANELPLQLERNGKMETVYLNFIYHPLRDPEGMVAGVIAVAIDISEQVRYRQSVEDLNRNLLLVNADLDNFVYAASHDLKAPILNIEGLMKALVADLPAPLLAENHVSRILNLIQASVLRFKKTVADLAEVAKTQRLADDDQVLVDLGEAIAAVLLDFELSIAESEAQISLDIPPEVIIPFSAKNMRSIIYNLVNNALKYRAANRPPVIRIKAEVSPDEVVLSVQDNGMGMDMTQESKIFTMFKRLHDHVEGSGIGLYIVKRILENAGGRITVESQVQQGSTFRVYFRR